MDRIHLECLKISIEVLKRTTDKEIQNLFLSVIDDIVEFYSLKDQQTITDKGLGGKNNGNSNSRPHNLDSRPSTDDT